MKKDFKIGDYVVDCTPELIDRDWKVIAVTTDGRLVVQNDDTLDIVLQHPEFAMLYDEAYVLLKDVYGDEDPLPEQQGLPADKACDVHSCPEGCCDCGLDDDQDYVEDAGDGQTPLTDRLYCYGDGSTVHVNVGDKVKSLDRYGEYYQQHGVVTALGLKDVCVLFDNGGSDVLDPRDLFFVDRPTKPVVDKKFFTWPGWDNVTYDFTAVLPVDDLDKLVNIYVDPDTGVVKYVET